MNALTIARVNLVRLLRDRNGLFFIFLLPLILILVLGTIYGGRVAPRLGLLLLDEGPLAVELANAVEQGSLRLEVRRLAGVEELRDAVESGLVEVGLVIPAGHDQALRSGGTAQVTVLGRPTSMVSALRQAVAAAVAAQSARVAAARLAADHTGVAVEAALVRAASLQASMPGVGVAVTSVGTGLFPEDAGLFSLGAQSQLVLFMFLTSMTAATQLIVTRQLGVTRRMASSPTPLRTILLGETLGRFGVAMLQGAFIVLVSAAVFGVDWGDPLAATALVVAFALVGTGLAMVIGVFGRDVDQAGTLGVGLGMLLGALGGAMVPLEIFGEPMRTLAHLTPHAWAVEGFRALAFEGAGVTGILGELAVLAAMATGLLALGTWGLRRALTQG